MRRLVIVAALALLGAAPPPSSEDQPAGEGVLCMMALVDAAAEVGRQCYPNQDAALQAELGKAEVQLDSYFMKNGPATPAQLATFKHEQAGVGNAKADVCSADGTSIYKSFAEHSEALTQGLDKLLARPGRPTFGDCL